MAVQTQIQTRRGTAATWTSTNPTLAAGEIGFESDTGKFKIGTGSTAWNSLAYSAGATAVTYLYNATSGQTTFSGTDANGLTLAYTVGAEQVFLNGVLQVRGTDYTATNGTSVVLASGALTSDVLNIIAYSALTITDTYTQAQADAKFVQQINNFFAGKNKIINGDFGVWQRGTSFSGYAGATYNFTADRWVAYSYASSTLTVSQQTFTAGAAPVSGYESQYFMRVNSTNTGNFFGQRIEDVRTLAGQTVTISYWAKAQSAQTLYFVRGVQYFGSGGSSSVETNVSTNPSLTTSWQRFTHTITLPSISGKTIGAGNYLSIEWYGNTPSNYIDIWGVQVEAGSIATPFQTATGTIQGELAACQRYYYRNAPIGNAFSWVGQGWANNTLTSALVGVQMPLPMRTTPTAIDYSTLGVVWYNGATTVASLAISGESNNYIAKIDITTSTNLPTAGMPIALRGGGLSGYFGLSAEL
jgi:hypothetical protein